MKSRCWNLIEERLGYEVEIRELANMLDMNRSETVRRWYKGISLPDYNSCLLLGKIMGINGGTLYAMIREL